MLEALLLRFAHMSNTLELESILRGAMGLDPLAYRTDPRLVEVSFGDWEGHTLPELAALVPERVWQEFSRGLAEARPERMFEVLQDCGLADKLLNEIPGVSSVRPRGALYCFPRLDPEVYPIDDDQQFVIDLLRAKKLLVTHGSGFNWPKPDHFRLVTLPDVDVLEEAIGRIAKFLEHYRKRHSL